MSIKITTIFACKHNKKRMTKVVVTSSTGVLIQAGAILKTHLASCKMGTSVNWLEHGPRK
jgi:hypothetical protein